MTDLDYLHRAEALLASIEQCCDRINDDTDADLDCQRTGGMVTITFSNRSQMVLNMQKPLQEIWLAAKDGGYHYRWSEPASAWTDTKTGRAFYSDINRCAHLHSGLDLKFSPA
jgi:CyaY protein